MVEFNWKTSYMYLNFPLYKFSINWSLLSLAVLPFYTHTHASSRMWLGVFFFSSSSFFRVIISGKIKGKKMTKDHQIKEKNWAIRRYKCKPCCMHNLIKLSINVKLDSNHQKNWNQSNNLRWWKISSLAWISKAKKSVSK